MSDIAIVDDELNICRSLAVAFAQNGWPTRTFQDPLVALPHLISQPPRLLILNGYMPRMNGVSFFQRFRPYSRCPIVILSASAEEIADTLLNLGLAADASITKPFSLRHVVQTCTRLLAAKR